MRRAINRKLSISFQLAMPHQKRTEFLMKICGQLWAMTQFPLWLKLAKRSSSFPRTVTISMACQEFRPIAFPNCTATCSLNDANPANIATVGLTTSQTTSQANFSSRELAGRRNGRSTGRSAKLAVCATGREDVAKLRQLFWILNFWFDFSNF